MHRQDLRSPTKVISVSKEKEKKRKKEGKKKKLCIFTLFNKQTVIKLGPDRRSLEQRQNKMQRSGW